MNVAERNLILAGEISAFLHDLGKLHPGFAKEKLDGTEKLSKKVAEAFRKSTKIREPHGAILEEGSVYPNPDERRTNPDLQPCLQQLLKNTAWAESLRLPENWIQAGTVQASGLGVALRQHHAHPSNWPIEQASLLGDLYSMGADIRDSSLDKGSSGTRNSSQTAFHAGISDSFGQWQHPYGSDTLAPAWQQMPSLLQCLWKDGASQNVVATRRELYGQSPPVQQSTAHTGSPEKNSLQRLFRQALGETRRPTHDVTLWHHSFSTASHFKAALAEGVLRQDFARWQDETGLFDVGKMGQIRFRLLGIRWNWRELTRQAFRPVTLVSLTQCRDEVIGAIRQWVEIDYPIGNLIYHDDDGVLILAPGFYETDAAASEKLFAEHVLNPLERILDDCIGRFGEGTHCHLHWSEPTLYLTDYAEALGLVEDSPRQRFVQAGVESLRLLWQEAPVEYRNQQIQICPQCGLRPAPTCEFELVQSSLKEQSLCRHCESLQSDKALDERHQFASSLFGFSPRTFNLQKITGQRGQGNSRVALISVQVDTRALASGNALITQLARPAHTLLKLATDWDSTKPLGNVMGDWFDELLKKLEQEDEGWLNTVIPVEVRNQQTTENSSRDAYARDLMGDPYWLKAQDGRVMGNDLAANALAVAQSFFLREGRHLPENLKLYRHDGDCLALFAQRKHPSPARLQRLWDDLRALWTTLLTEIAGQLGDAVIPLSLDASGVRFLVAAQDATPVIAHIEKLLATRLNKIRGGFAPQVSCLVFREKFPLYLGLDAIYRMEQRIPRLPHQAWKLKAREKLPDQRRQLVWQTPQGEVTWTVDLHTGDPSQDDLWHPHVIRSHRADGSEIVGPDRLTHIDRLEPGDTCLIPPATFDFMVLEGGIRRYQIAYEAREDQLYRPHLVFGQQGQAVGLLEQFGSLTTLVKRTGWKSSQIKALQGEMIELYEKWVRDAPASLRTNGQNAWRVHVEAMLLRYLPCKTQAPLRAEMLEAVQNGRFFDAVEWTTFISKGETTP